MSRSIQEFRPEVTTVPTESLIPYANNARTHSEKQVAQIAASIKEFGFVNPILVDGENGVIAGHGRLLAAQKLGLAEVPTIQLAHLSEAQKKALILADNRLAEKAGWDLEMLKVELDELESLDFELTTIGFELSDLEEMGLGPEPEGSTDDGLYTQKVQTPIYEPSEKCPDLKDLIDRTKANQLQAEIKKAKLPADLEKFLMDSAERFVEFRFDYIADYYAHAPAEVQELMENSALVIVDYEKAIERGFVRLKEDSDKAFALDYPDA